MMQTGYEQNFGANSNPRYDALLAAAASDADEGRRYHYFEQAEKPYLKGWRLNLQDRLLSRYLYVLEHEGR